MIIRKNYNNVIAARTFGADNYALGSGFAQKHLINVKIDHVGNYIVKCNIERQ